VGPGGRALIERGSVVVVDLDPTLGHEQRGMRPCVVVSDPEVVAAQRYPLLAIVPITARAGEGALYPALAAGASGLRQPSWALADQVRSVDKRRVQRLVGHVSEAESAAIDQALALYLGLAS
jgi:mRNA interferase MazF